MNSIPKAGTHLLTALIDRFPNILYSGEHRSLQQLVPNYADEPEADLADLRGWLTSIDNGRYATSHFPAYPPLLNVLDVLGFRVLFIMRDPRDIVVSHAIYVHGLTRHHLNARYQTMAGAEERLMASIVGLPGDGVGAGLPSIGERLDQFLPWTRHSSTLTVRFEDLVGSRGGGDEAEKLRSLQKIGTHVLRPLTDEQLISVGALGGGSATMRKGVIGDWRNHFSDAHVEAFKTSAGGHLVSLGYEADSSWNQGS